MRKFLLLSSLAFALASAPILFAQDDSNSTTDLSAGAGDDTTSGGGEHGGRWKEVFAQLHLSEAQKAQIKQIRASTQPGKERRRQVMAVLTPEQKSKLVAMIKGFRAAQGNP